MYACKVRRIVQHVISICHIPLPVACIGDLYLNDERNDIARVDYEVRRYSDILCMIFIFVQRMSYLYFTKFQNRWDFHGSTCILGKFVISCSDH